MRPLQSPLRLLGLALLGAMLVLGVACSDDSADADATGDETSSPTAGTPDPMSTVIATVEDSRDNAGGGIEPATPDAPPEGTLASDNGEVELGLGSYCWSPPTGSGNPALCVDTSGVITSTNDLSVEPGETLTIADEEPGTLPWPPLAIQSATLTDAPGEPIQSEADYRAWRPEGGFESGVNLETDSSQIGAHTITLPEDLEPGRYLLAIFYTAGEDRGSDATYGATLVVE